MYDRLSNKRVHFSSDTHEKLSEFLWFYKKNALRCWFTWSWYNHNYQKFWYIISTFIYHNMATVVLIIICLFQRSNMTSSASAEICPRWVLRLLAKEQKKIRSTASLEYQFDRDPENFKRRLVTGDESWIFRFDPETKQMSMQQLPKGSRPPTELWNLSVRRYWR